MKPPFDEILILDFESRWSSKPVEWAPEAYSLSKMTTEEYIRSSLFKAFGAGFKYYGRDETPVYLTNPFLSKFFASVDWSRTAVCCHNAQFDAAILTWIYGIKPAFIFDTLSMARALRGLEVGNSAAKLADDFGLPPKGRAVYSTDGMFEPDLVTEQELANYCKHDVWLCEQFLKRLLPGYPAKELRLIDATIRMFTEPQLALDADLLKEAIDEDNVLRSRLLGNLGRVDAELASDQLFAETLRAVGVEPPTKISKTTGKVAFAFAKNDALFQQILNGDNEDAVLLCEARMKVKSTQERTRAQRFLDISGRADGLLPVPVNYAHTRTLRWGAAKGSNINMQNLKRGGKLRKSIVAPPGHTIVAGDLSQIEPRVLAHLADYQELIDIFASGKDAYAQFGAGMFGIPDLNRESHPDLRQSAKSALLGCFGAGTKVRVKTGAGTGTGGIHWMRIEKVRLTDLVWDGEEWVAHTGVVYQGVKKTLEYMGLAATEDHLVMDADDKWISWKEWVFKDLEFTARKNYTERFVTLRTQEEKVYDISNAGPRNRFTILVPHMCHLIVHNCGYRLGWASFASQLLVGFLGAPPVRYDRAFMKQLGIGKAEAIAFCEGKAGADRLARMADIPHTCTEQELLVHCVCAKTIIDRYRATSEPIVAFWGFLDKMVATVLSVPDAEPVVYKCLTFKPGQIILPNGLPIRYDNIKCTVDELGRPQYTYWNGKTDKPLHSGIVAENVTSGTARCVIGDGMLRVQRRWPVCLTVHDELVIVVKDAEVSEAKGWVKEQLTVPVSYLPGIPLDATIGADRSYGNCK